MRPLAALFLFVFLAFLILPAPAAAQSIHEEVNLAIERGVHELLKDQREDGTFAIAGPGSTGLNARYPMGVTSLAVYALLKSGLSPEDPMIKRAVGALRYMSFRKTYSGMSGQEKVSERPRAEYWRTRTTEPAAGWTGPGFDDSEWSRGAACFGSFTSGAGAIRTLWLKDDIWIRREFEWKEEDAGAFRLFAVFDDRAEIFVNGVLAAKFSKWSEGKYVAVPISDEARAVLKKGRNVLAAHCSNDKGGAQVIDVRFRDIGRTATRAGDRCIYCAATWLDVDRECEAVLWVGADDGVRVLFDNRASTKNWRTLSGSVAEYAGQEVLLIVECAAVVKKSVDCAFIDDASLR